MNKSLQLLAALKCQESYENNSDFGTTEFQMSTSRHEGKLFQILAIPGTNELADWWWNLNLASWDGVKIGAYRAAKTIFKNFERHSLPLLITCHSKSGPTGLYLKHRYFPDATCVAFAPARGFRPWSIPVLKDTVIFTDPNDVVDKIGAISFRHPDCEFITAPDDRFFPAVDQHVMAHWVEFLSG